MDMPTQPVLAHDLEGVLWWLERRQPIANAFDCLAASLSRLLDRHHIWRADHCPDLFTCRIASHHHERLGPGWHDADVVTDKSWIGQHVARCSRLETSNLEVGECLSGH